MSQSELIVTLQQHFKFTPQDLAANRGGRLSPPQQTRLDRASRTTRMLFVIASLLFIIVALASIVADVPTAALVFGGVGLAILGVLYWNVRDNAQRNDSVARLHGPITLERTRRRRTGRRSTTVFTLRIADATFEIDQTVYDALADAITRASHKPTAPGADNHPNQAARLDVYTLYVLPSRRKILSLEPSTGAWEGEQIATPLGEPRPGRVNGELQRAIDVLDAHNHAEQWEEATATLHAAGPAIVPLLESRLHQPRYRTLVSALGTPAIAPLMRLVARRGSFVEGPLLDRVVSVLSEMPLEELETELPAYLDRRHSPAVRMAALRVLGHRRNPQRIRILQQAAQDPEPAIAARAQQTLARIDQLNGFF